MEKNDFITFEELMSVMESGSSDKNFLAVVDHLVEALTDWPEEKELYEIIPELKNQIKGSLTIANLHDYLKSLNVNSDAWKIESVTSLLKVFVFARNNNFDKSLELEVILDRITKYYRAKSYC
jgi:hypothetical protein